MSGTSLTVENILTIFAVTPSRSAELIGHLTEAQLHAAPTPGEWSAN